MNAEQFLILLDSVAESHGLASEPVYNRIYQAVYEQLERCVYCGGVCKLGDERQCDDCRRFEASRREE